MIETNSSIAITIELKTNEWGIMIDEKKFVPKNIDKKIKLYYVSSDLSWWTPIDDPDYELRRRSNVNEQTTMQTYYYVGASVSLRYFECPLIIFTKTKHERTLAIIPLYERALMFE